MIALSDTRVSVHPPRSKPAARSSSVCASRHHHEQHNHGQYHGDDDERVSTHDARVVGLIAWGAWAAFQGHYWAALLGSIIGQLFAQGPCRCRREEGLSPLLRWHMAAVAPRRYLAQVAAMTAGREAQDTAAAIQLPCTAPGLINAQDDTGFTAVMHASLLGSIAIVDALLGTRVCDIHRSDLHGDTAMHFAVCVGGPVTIWHAVRRELCA